MSFTKITGGQIGRERAGKLKSDQVFIPYLWTEQGKDITKVSKKEVPIEEYYRLTLELERNLDLICRNKKLL